MDCRRTLEVLEFDAAPAEEFPVEVFSAEERAAAEAHLETCPACARAVESRRQLDRTIGDVMRAVPIPRGAQQRLLAQLAELEAAEGATAASQTKLAHASSNGQLAQGPESGGGQGTVGAGECTAPLKPARWVDWKDPVSRRRFLKRLVPVAASLVIALGGFFGVVRYFMPSWSVGEVSDALAKVDFDRLPDLPNFTGKDALSRFTEEPGWDRLQWRCGREAKGLPLASDVIAVYGFEIPKSRRPGSEAVRGLIALIPLSKVRNVPAANSLAMATPTSGYVQAQIGESIAVAWQQGDAVCVCLIRGDANSLSTLQGMLEQPAA